MKTTITYKVDKTTLENAIRECIFLGFPPIIKNIKRTIQSRVHECGLSAISFPENWHVTDEELKFYPQSKIDELVSKLHGRIN